MTLRRVSSSGVNCRSGPEQVERLDLLADELVGPVQFSWNSGSVSKSHAIVCLLHRQGFWLNPAISAAMSHATTSAKDRSPNVPSAQCRTPSLTCIWASRDRWGTSMWSAELAVGLRLGEQLAEHVGVDIVGTVTGQDASLLAVALQDRLDDQVARVAGHRALEAAQRLGDDGVHVVVTRQVLVHRFLRGAGGQQADLEEHVFLGREVEVEQCAGDACGPADVGDRRLGVAVRPPQRHRRLHQRPFGLRRAGLAEKRPGVDHRQRRSPAVLRHSRTVAARLTLQIVNACLTIYLRCPEANSETSDATKD